MPSITSKRALGIRSAVSLPAASGSQHFCQFVHTIAFIGNMRPANKRQHSARLPAYALLRQQGYAFTQQVAPAQADAALI